MAQSFDLIVYGDGAGALTAAYHAAKHGLRVLHLSLDAGADDRLIAIESAILAKSFGKSASAELGASKVIENRFWFVSAGAGTQLAYRADERSDAPQQWLMAASAFEAWVAAQAKSAGAACENRGRIAEMMYDRNERLQAVRLADGSIVRTRALVIGHGGEHLVKDEIFAEDGPELRRVVSLRQSLSLDADTLRGRFCLEEGEGFSGAIVGNLVNSRPARAWLKSDGSKLEIGLQVVGKAMDEALVGDANAALEALKSAGSLKPLLKGASAGALGSCEKTITGFKYVSQIYGNGWLLIGKSTRLADPLRVESVANDLQCGAFACDAVERCFKANDTSKRAMGVYHALIEDSFVMKNLKAQKNAIEELEKDPSLMGFYSDFFNRWFGHDTEATLEARKERNKSFFQSLRNERPVWEFAMGMRKGLKLLRD